MAQAFVDHAEAVKVDHDQAAELGGIELATLVELVDTVDQQLAVGKVGQHVVQGVVGGAILGHPAAVDIGHRSDDAVDPPQFVLDAQAAGLEPAVLLVAAQHPVFDLQGRHLAGKHHVERGGELCEVGLVQAVEPGLDPVVQRTGVQLQELFPARSEIDRIVRDVPVPQAVAGGFRSQCETLLADPQGFVGAFLFRDVADNDGEEGPAQMLEPAAGQLQQDRAAVGVLAFDLARGRDARTAFTQRLDVADAVFVDVVPDIGDQVFDALADHVLPCVAEDPLGRGVEVLDDPGIAGRDDALGDGGEHADHAPFPFPQRCQGFVEFGDVADPADQCADIVVFKPVDRRCLDLTVAAVGVLEAALSDAAGARLFDAHLQAFGNVRPVLRMHQRQRVGSDQAVGVVAEVGFDRGACVDEGGVSVDQTDRVGRMVDHGLQPLQPDRVERVCDVRRLGAPQPEQTLPLWQRFQQCLSLARFPTGERVAANGCPHAGGTQILIRTDRLCPSRLSIGLTVAPVP